MRLVLRRARGAKSLLLAATGATLIATALLTGLANYSRQVIDSGAQSAVASASPEERSLLVRGTAGGSQDELTKRDGAVRARFADGFAGVPATVVGAGYAAGRQLSGRTGDAVPDAQGVVFASVVYLDELAEHAQLTSGEWPRPGGRQMQTALAEPVAKILGVRVGDAIPITDRVTDRVTEVTVAGIWKPHDVRDAYWRLVPDVLTGVGTGSATYGPLVVDRADFLTSFIANSSAAWLVEPDLAGMPMTALTRLGRSADQASTTLPAETGLGTSGLVTTGLDELVQRLGRADLVGRSALVTPMLLVVVLGGYALLLVALLLGEQRRGETALLRARGAGRGQVTGLAAREALLVVLPAAVISPVLATEVIRLADRIPMLAAALHLSPRLDALTWLVAGVAAAGCALAMLGPALRQGDSYVSEMASRSRPSRRTIAQRAGLDLALIVLAVLGWLQLRQYSSPVAGAGTDTLGIDPLLAAAPTVGVLAGAVLALRGLPPMARLAERYVDRRSWTGTMLGMWQAGRRPHAGPVLLLALAVAVSTLAWCLAATSERSLTDQANHQVGADLRLVEANREAPSARAGQLAGLPGKPQVLPAWRESPRLGVEGLPGSMIALDAAQASQVVQFRDDLVDGSPSAIFDDMTADRITAPLTELPAGTRRLTGRITTTNFGEYSSSAVRTSAVFVEPGGGHRRIALGASSDGRSLRFDVDLAGVAAPARLSGFLVDTLGPPGHGVDWRLADLRAAPAQGAGTPVPLADGGQWRTVDRVQPGPLMPLRDDALAVRYEFPLGSGRFFPSNSPIQFAVARMPAQGQVPIVATPEALSALRLAVGQSTRLVLAGASVDITVTGTVAAVPGGSEAAALLVDLPSLSTQLFHQYGIIPATQEWWLNTSPGGHEATAEAAEALGGLQVADRKAIAGRSGSDPYGVGARAALFAAALGALLLAAVGIMVDVRATARRRVTELAVLHTLGAGPRLLARSLIVEQGFLAGIGVLVGLGVGIAVAATMAPLVILTPSAERPVPAPLLDITWLPVGGTAVLLLLVALGLSGLTAATVRQRLTAAQLRIGEDR
ncbi:ABC transporter permease [Plantactinospora sp. S1510]|uniref:ABC transporter permease n=1 Tax=Plantactinospora alkalitolerans TaxID=2789879 RepID=A0ABS0GR00_9ACTN|nr:ABC transporter permease [Plantactinospora alkalitolerans]MBF9128439.1 ABC transporter permease [Plantactinospora alkalitolerans]